MKDETLIEFDKSLKDISAEQNYINQALNQLSEEINSVTANASCEEIGKLNITEDGYYMIRVEYLSKIDVLYVGIVMYNSVFTNSEVFLDFNT